MTGQSMGTISRSRAGWILASSASYKTRFRLKGFNFGPEITQQGMDRTNLFRIMLRSLRSFVLECTANIRDVNIQVLYSGPRSIQKMQIVGSNITTGVRHGNLELSCCCLIGLIYVRTLPSLSFNHSPKGTLQQLLFRRCSETILGVNGGS